MVRNIYRFYLYAVCIILLNTATGTTAYSLGLLLSNSFLRPFGPPPAHAQLVQAAVAFVVVWVVTLLIGGLHYWLIRRDMATDPAAAGGAVRSYFLNITQLTAVLTAIGATAVGIAMLGDPNNSSVYAFSVALATGGLFAILQLERRRTRVTTNVARAFQRVHLYGAQLIIVFIATPFWMQAVQPTVLAALAAMGRFDPCAYYSYYYVDANCNPQAYYTGRQIVAKWAAALFVAACWLAYTAYTRSDRFSKLRQVTHLLAGGFGLSFVLQGAQGVFVAILRAATGHPFPEAELAYGAAQATGALVFGAVAVLAYYLLYTRESAELPSGLPGARLAWQALLGIVFAYSFWVGLRSLAGDVVERLVPTGSPTPATDFARDGAMLLVGLPFVLVAVQLGARTRQTGVSWPHRVFVLILLAAGTIGGAGGLVFALQALVSTLLGAPADGWQQTARGGVVTLLVGATMVAIFATVAVRNHYLTGREELKPSMEKPVPTDTQPVAVPGAAAPAMPVTSNSLEAVLDALLAGSLSRDEAAARIRAGGAEMMR